MIKQVIVVRKDLNMRKGKLAAQVAHASIAPFTNRMTMIRHELASSAGYRMAVRRNVRDLGLEDLTELNQVELIVPQYVMEWMARGFTKVVVYVNSEQELLDLYKQAETSGFWCSMITDSGRTEFHDVPTNTCFSILGPADKVDKITGDLPLM